MQDFIGQEIVVGGWVAASGKGNVACEYGFILYKVLATSPTLKLQRIHVSYKDGQCEASVKTSTVTNTNKYVVVSPPPAVVDFYNRIATGTATAKDHNKAGLWIHGQKPLQWSNKEG